MKQIEEQSHTQTQIGYLMKIVPRSQSCKRRLDNERMLLPLDEYAELAPCSFIKKLVSNEIFLHSTSTLQILHNSCRCRISFSLRPSPSASPDSRSLSPGILPALYSAAGLEAVEADMRNAPPHLALAMHECNLTIHEQLVARQSRNQAVLQAVRDLMPQVVAETRQGACWAFTRWTVVGQKKTAAAENVVK